MTPAVSATAPRIGTSLFCFTREFHAGRYDLESLVRLVAAERVGPGLELVGHQAFRGFPHPSPNDVRAFRQAMDAAGLTPICLDGEVDLALRRDRLATFEETVASVRAQLEAAAILGFPVLRIQMLAGPDVVEACADDAERLGVALGVELDSFYSVHHPAVVRMRERVERLSSPCVGFVPDFGASMRAIPAGLVDGLRRQGVRADVVAIATRIWEEHTLPDDRFAALREQAATLDITDAEFAACRVPLTVCGAQDPEDWRAVVPYAVHAHAKFFAFDGEGNEPSVDYPAVVRVLQQEGYGGWLSSEWGGVMYDERSSATELLQQHHRLLRRLWDTRAAPMIYPSDRESSTP